MNDLEHTAIERLKIASEMSLANYGLPLVITDSGGKDSSVVKELAIRSGIPFEVMHSHTTADAPETVRFVRQEAKRFEELGIKYAINMPTYKGKRVSMWNLIPQKLMPPTRLDGDATWECVEAMLQDAASWEGEDLDLSTWEDVKAACYHRHDDREIVDALKYALEPTDLFKKLDYDQTYGSIVHDYPPNAKKS